MTKITCDRCGKPIFNYPWMQAKFPMLTIMCVPGAHDAAHSIDLCDNCTDDFQIWLNDYDVLPQQEEMNK